MKAMIFSMAAVATSLMTTTAQASTYLCLGVDENNGFAKVEATVDSNGYLRPFGHVQGQEVRLMERDGRLSLTIKKNDGTMTVIVVSAGDLLYRDGAINLSCTPK